MLSSFEVLLNTLHSLLRARGELALEILALRQQLAVYRRKLPRPRLRMEDRLFWVVLRHVWSGWENALLIVKPDTVVRWHQRLFQQYWGWRSKLLGRPRKDKELRDLIRKMATENQWGAPRIHGELLKLGFRICERTVSRYLQSIIGKGRRGGGGAQSWKTFLTNHRNSLAAMDFLVVPTATFGLLCVLVILHHDRRRVLHSNVTANPTSAWVCQQLREAFPGDSPAPKYLLMDNDSIFSAEVVRTIKGLGIEAKRTGFQSPWMNGVSERFNGVLRRELLDHVIVLGENHLRRLIGGYLAYYHTDRTHLTLGKDCPESRSVTPRPSPGANVVSLPRAGGLHHRYEWKDAA